MLKRLGVEVEYYDPLVGAGIDRLMKPNTKLVFTESPASNTFEMQDIPAIAKAAHAGGAIVVMDNTWATPVYFRALDHGVDVTVHASTKYPAGHSDVLLGTVSANAACWPQLNETFLTLGVCAGPDDVYQVLRGLRTMGVRLERHQESALEIARWLEGQAGRRARPAPGAGKPSRPRHLEARFLRRPAASSRSCSPAAARTQAACLPRRAEDLRPRLFLGRLRKPRRAGLPRRPHHRQGAL